MDIICDIDGTLADLTHRRHHVREKPKNWPAFFAGIKDDDPIIPVCNTVRTLHANGHNVFFVSGRNEASRQVTRTWLKDVAGLWDPDFGVGSATDTTPRAAALAPGTKFIIRYATGLFMRADGDYRSDDIVKEEILDKMLLLGIRPAMVFDDRDRVVKMWRRRGIVCAQVAEGDF